eukprot:m.146430 g.146430  ORF g.146430 m.146430 type:complete len:108 (+) comp24310_c3_seq2:1621-1944(+)
METLREIIIEERPGSGLAFQIAAVDALPCVLWVVVRYFRDPMLAIQKACALGGDTDTIASMVGAIVGALHGPDWIPAEWLQQIEDAEPERGTSYVRGLARKLADLEG